MRMPDCRTWLLLVVAVALFFAVGVVPSAAQEQIKISGTITAVVTESNSFKVGDTDGHVFLISKSEGVNANTGKNTFMDGGLVVNNNFGDLTKGSGPHEGYVILRKEGGSAIARWEGNVTTTMSAGNIPITTMEGTFSYTKGTGQFENIEGGGTYKGKYVTEKTYVVDWEGKYSIRK